MSRLVVIPTGGVAAVSGGFATYKTYGEFLHQLAETLGGILLYAPVFDTRHPEYEYFAQLPLDPQVCQVVPLPAHSRATGGTRLIANYWRQLRVFLRDAPRWTDALIYSPSATASLAALALQLRGAPGCRIVPYVWGDWVQVSRHLPQPGVIRGLLAPFQAGWIVRQERWLIRRASGALVAGAVLRERYAPLNPRVEETIPMLNFDELLAAEPPAARHGDQVLYVGRVAPGKGLEQMAHALARLVEARPALQWRIVGGGDREFVASFQRLLAGMRLSGNTTLVGVIPNGPRLWAEYRQAAVLVLPSLSEGFPRVLYEAMAHATPIVATDVGSISRVLRPDVEALIVPPGDETALARAVEVLLGEPERARQLGRAARGRFDGRFASGPHSKAGQVAGLVRRAREG